METQAVQNTTESAPVVPSQEATVPTTQAEYAEWRNKGTLPKQEAQPAKKKEDSAPSKEPSAATAETAPDSDTDTKKDTAPKGTRLKERSADLQAEIDDLNAKLAKRAELRKQLAEPDDKKPAVSSPAEASKDPKAPVRPKVEDFKTFDEYEAAKDKYNDEAADYKVQKALADERARQQQEVARQGVQQKVEEGKKRYADFEKTVAPVLKGFVADPEVPQFVKQAVGDSPVMVDVLYVLGGDPVQFENFLQDAKTNPIKAIKTIAVLENLVMQELEGGDKTRNDKGQFTKEQESSKKSTSAPPPPKEVSGRGTPPADEVESAAKSSDFRAFRAAANRRDVSRRG